MNSSTVRRSHSPSTKTPTLASGMIEVSRRLAERTRGLRFSPPVTHVYHPLDYARKPHETYLSMYGSVEREVLLLGMNPGPWGMAQTGVPFGEVNAVRKWLGIDERVEQPANVHSKRPVQGLDCTRNEVSGARLWGWAETRFVKPEAFFRRFFVANYCPLCFLEASGCNRTPDKLPASEREALYAVCDEALRETVVMLKPQIVIGVGVFAEVRAKGALAGFDVRIGRIPHPSPASPTANRGWAKQAETALESLGISLK